MVTLLTYHTGDKSKEKIIEYSKEIANFLVSKNVKMIVIACGTASASAYDFLKNSLSIPVQNIIEPTAQTIADKEIGVIATKATIKSKAWETAILRYNPDAKITSIACPLLVPLIEEGFINNIATDLILKEYLNNFFNNGKLTISSLILGCTHYPILKDKIQALLGNNVNIINAGTYSAESTKRYLESNAQLNSQNEHGKIEFHTKLLNFEI